MNKKEVLALSAALLACLLWSGNFLAARGVHEWIPPFGLAFWRWAVAAVVISPFAMKHVCRQWSIIKQHWRFLFLVGVTSVGSYNTLIYLGAHYTTTHHIALISSTAMIWTLLLASIIGTERLSRYKIGGTACALGGALVIISHGNIVSLFNQEWNRGDLLALAASWVWAVYCILLHFKPKELHPLAFLNVIFVIGLLSLLPFYLWEISQSNPAPFTAKALSVYAYIGIGASVIAWFAWNHAVQGVGAIKAGLLYYAMPVFSGVLAYLFLGEPLAIYHAIGFVLIFAGIVIANLRKIGLAE